MAAIRTASPHAPARAAPVHPVRQIAASDLRAVLAEGWADFLDKRGDLVFIGLIYPLIGLFAAALFLGGNLVFLFFPIAAGVALLGPVAATGFYELARRREAGLDCSWHHFLSVRHRPNFEQIMTVAGLLVTIFAGWILVAALLYVALLGGPPASLGAFLTELFTTPEGWALIVVGNLAGFGFAVLVLAISVASLPMLVDREGSAREAIETSLAAFRANKGVLLRWGAIVAALLAVGSIPAFVGLAVVLPWLGYSTWHLYTRLVDRSALSGPA